MATFDSIFICVILHRVICKINQASKSVHKKYTNSDEATLVLNHLCEKEFRNSYKEQNIKRQFDELALDYQSERRHHLFKVNVFYCILVFGKINSHTNQ